MYQVGGPSHLASSSATMDTSKHRHRDNIAANNNNNKRLTVLLAILAYAAAAACIVTCKPTRIILPSDPTSASSLAPDQSVSPAEHLPQPPPPLAHSIPLSAISQPSYVAHKSEPFMQLHELSESLPNFGNNITCNDGTPVGYYKRLSRHSKSWVIYLQGGGFCGSEESCQQRWQRSPHLMSSSFWPKNKTVDGILSHEPKDNPFLWNANHIYVPYCSSDSWSGLAQATVTGSNPLMYDSSSDKEGSTNVKDRRQVSTFSFMGSKIIERVIESLYEDLPSESSLHNARYILFAGDSAGATGVILNLDKVDQFIEHKYEESRLRCLFQLEQSNCHSIQRPILRGLSDSGWFLDNEPYDFSDHNLDQVSDYISSSSASATTNDEQLKLKRRDQQQYQQNNNDNTDVDCDKQQCTPLQSIRRAMIHWNGQVPLDCANRYTNEPWRCYFGYRAYKSLKTPLFVVQWLYDEAQLMFDNIGHPDTSGQWNYVKKVVNQMKSSLENVTALFAPSCFSHSLVTKQSWNQININGFKLPYVLNNWEEQAMLNSAGSFAIRAQGSRLPTDVVSSYQSPGRVIPYNDNRPSATIYPFEPTHSSPINNDGPSFRDDNDRTTHSSSHVELRRASQHRSISSVARSRGRKKKRNNPNQHRSRQVPRVPKVSVSSNDNTSGNNYNQASQITTNRDSNDWNGFQSNPPLQVSSEMQTNDENAATNRTRSSSTTNSNRSGPIDNTHPNVRPGRSTIYDEVGWSMNSNNVPDDADNKPAVRAELANGPSSQIDSFSGSYISSSGVNQDPNAFKLMDACGWPQCNSNCPIIDQIGINIDPP